MQLKLCLKASSCVSALLPVMAGRLQACTSAGDFWVVSGQTLFSDMLLGLPCPTDPVLLYKLSQVIFQLLSHLFVLACQMQNGQVCHLCSVTIFPIPNNFATAFVPCLLP